MTSVAAAVHRSADFRLHPLGFFYLLDRYPDGVTNRVHVWLTDGPSPAENDQHQHSFDINSRIVTGGIRNELYQFHETKNGIEREYAVMYADGRSFLRPTGRMGTLDLICKFDSTKGESYYLKAGVIHRTLVMQTPCVTMLTTHERGITILSYGKEDEPPFDRRAVSPHEAEEIRAMLGTLTAGRDTG